MEERISCPTCYLAYKVTNSIANEQTNRSWRFRLTNVKKGG